MKHSIVLKFLAIVLAALSLVSAVGGAAGIVAIESAGLYVGGLDELQGHAYSSIAKDIANIYAEYYAADNLGDLPYQLMEDRYTDPTTRTDAEHWYVTLQQDGKIIAHEGKRSDSYAYSKEFTITPLYVTASLTDPDSTIATEEPQIPDSTETLPENPLPTEPEIPEPAVPDNYLYSDQETVLNGNRLVTYYLDYFRAPEYTVTVYLREDVLESSSLYLLNDIYQHRYSFIFLVAFGLLLSAVCLVYLVNAAGCTSSGALRPGGLNRLPLDLYALLVVGGIAALWVLLMNLCEWADSEGPHLGNLSLIGMTIMGIALIGIALIFAFSAQIKAGNGYWWKHSIIGWCCRLFLFCVRQSLRLISAISKTVPLIWRWLLLAVVLTAGTAVSAALCKARPGFWAPLILCSLGGIAAVLYCGYCTVTLLKGTQRMNQGDMGEKIDNPLLRGAYADFANQLNALSETAMIAAQKQMRSERMKSELITNVTHDIKTPLTSIINFVDLLQKPHSLRQQQEYLEVLNRQSAQMKKLIEDLIELSKATSGSISVNLQPVDAVEAINQALGEFSDKLESAGLVPVFHHSADSMKILADGRLSWRVVSNLLNNAVKYALPGTRLYIDLVQAEDSVLLSLKNISKEPLTTEPEELLERFVQGDISRKSEGSGLGLNIAKTLMEIQGGKLRLMLDGDLFKVTLIFPAAPEDGENS